MLKSFFFIGLVWMILFGNSTLLAQSFPNIDYILKYKAMALVEMRESKIPASITLAQGVLESENGRSYLATEGYNHFGIKCKSHYVGKAIFRTDDAEDECFRVYESVQDSYRDHSNFLINNQRYAFLFDYKLTDYKAWAKGLKKAGYATNPKYPEILMRIIKENALDLLDVSEKKWKEKYIESSDNKFIESDLDSIEIIEKEPEIVIEKTKEELEKEALIEANRVFRNSNGSSYILALKGEDFETISKRFDIWISELNTFNDLDEDIVFEGGEKIYIRPKKNKGSKKTYRVQENGETIYTISQKLGIKLSKLLKRNKSINTKSVFQKGKEIKLK